MSANLLDYITCFLVGYLVGFWAMDLFALIACLVVLGLICWWIFQPPQVDIHPAASVVAPPPPLARQQSQGSQGGLRKRNQAPQNLE